MKPGEGRVAQIRAVAERIARDFGLDVFDVQLRRESVGWLLRIVIDRPPSVTEENDDTAGESVTLDDCQRVSTDVSVVPCAECGEALEPRWLFCIACGTETGSS